MIIIDVQSVFVDANYGQYCNISSSKGIEQISTALHVIQILNEYDYVPGWQLGKQTALHFYNRSPSN